MKRVARRTMLGCTLVLAACDAAAQAAAVAPMMSAVGHKFLTDRTGWLLNTELPLLREVYLRFQFETSAGTGDHVGTVCFEPAEGCEEEPIDDHSEFRSASLAAPIHMVARSRIVFSLIPQLITGRMRIRMTGRSTGEELEASRDFRGVGIGAEFLLRTAETSRFAVALGARYASLAPRRYRRPDVVHPLSREFSDNARYIGVRIGR